MRTRTRTGLALIALLAIVGCEGFGRGVTQAVLEGSSEPTEDTRSCEVEGRPFPGIEPFLEAQDRLPPFSEGETGRPEVKVLYVHGIGTHVPGDGTALRNNVATSLGLDDPGAAAKADRDRPSASFPTRTWARSTSHASPMRSAGATSCSTS